MFVHVCDCVIYSIFWLHPWNFSYRDCAFFFAADTVHICSFVFQISVIWKCKTQALCFIIWYFVSESQKLNIKNVCWHCWRFFLCKKHISIPKLQWFKLMSFSSRCHCKGKLYHIPSLGHKQMNPSMHHISLVSILTNIFLICHDLGMTLWCCSLLAAGLFCQ